MFEKNSWKFLATNNALQFINVSSPEMQTQTNPNKSWKLKTLLIQITFTKNIQSKPKNEQLHTSSKKTS